MPARAVAAAHPGRAAASPLRGQVARFALVGVGSTVLATGLFALLDQVMARQWANVVSLVLSTIANTAVNRRYTFGASGRQGAARVQAGALALLAVTIAVTAGALRLLEALVPDARTTAAVVAFVVGNALATIARFVLLRRWTGH